MKSALQTLTLSATLLAGSLLHAASAHACSCMRPPAPAVAAANATAVFEGHVLEVHEGANQAAPVRVTLNVVRSFKGADSEQLELTTPANSAGCGFGFEVGKSYLVYATSDSTGRLSTNLCSRTRPMSDAAEDIAELGMGATPVDPNGPGAIPDAPDKEEPAKGGCASCSIGDVQASEAWPLLMALLLVARRRQRR